MVERRLIKRSTCQRKGKKGPVFQVRFRHANYFAYETPNFTNLEAAVHGRTKVRVGGKKLDASHKDS